MVTIANTHEAVGIIDLGSNSARLIVAQYRRGESVKIVYEYSRRVRLAEGMGAAGLLHASAMDRAVETLRMFRDFCAANGVRRVIPVATAATRDAHNGPAFLKRVRRETGLRLRVLSGEEEAYYGTLGVINATGLQAGAVMDLGGGSAELSRVRAGRYQRSVTLPIGAVRLTERFLPDERASAGAVRRLYEHLETQLDPLTWLRLRPGETFVGLGGTIRTLARIDRDGRDYPLRLLNGYRLELDALEELIERLRAYSVKERAKRVPGLAADRADVILAGAIAVSLALRQAGTDGLVVCDQGLRDGLLYREFLRPTDPPLIDDLRRFSVLNLNRVYGYAGPHADHVAGLALQLFDQTRRRHGLGPAERDWLWAAAQLNDLGSVINPQDHHRHSAYLIRNAGLPGYSHREVALISLLCIFQHKGKSDQEQFAALLEKGDDKRLAVLGGLLRLAEALDSSRTQDVSAVRLTVAGNRARLTLRGRPGADLRWESGEAQRNAGLFEDAFKLRLQVA